MNFTDEQTDLLTAEALGALDRADRPALRHLLDSTPGSVSTLDRLEQTAALLAFSAPPTRPRPDLKSAVLDNIKQMQQTRSPRAEVRPARAASRFSFDDLLPWLAVALLAITSAWLWAQNARTRSENVQLRNTLLQTSSLHGAVLVGQNAFASGKAELVFCTRMQRGKLVVHGLQQPGPGQAYQLWFQTGPAKPPVSAGVFTVTSEDDCEIPIRPSIPVQEVTKAMVSIEKTGGATVASGPVVLAGQVL